MALPTTSPLPKVFIHPQALSRLQFGITYQLPSSFIPTPISETMTFSALDPEIAAILAQMPPLPKGPLTIEQRRAGFGFVIEGMRKGLEPLLPNGNNLSILYNSSFRN